MASAGAASAAVKQAVSDAKGDGTKQWLYIAAGAVAAAGLSYLGYTLWQRSRRPVVRIGTRESKLAMWQAEHVRAKLQGMYPQLNFCIVGMTTMGDQNLTDPLSNFSNKGVFTKELDVALLNGSIDLAVHCMKDLPTTLPDGIAFATVLPRGDVEDALVINTAKHPGAKGLDDLPAGAVVGTSALRRVAVLAQHYPALHTKNVRGNVNTRLAKLDAGEYDALILAHTGLKRLGLGKRVSQVLASQRFGYAVGQGALAVVARAGDVKHIDLCTPLTDAPTLYACEAERGLLRELQGGCKVPIVVRSTIKMTGVEQMDLCLYGSVISLDGLTSVESDIDLSGLPQRVPPKRNRAAATAAAAAASAAGAGVGAAAAAVAPASAAAAAAAAAADEETDDPAAEALARARSLGEALGVRLKVAGADAILQQIKG